MSYKGKIKINRHNCGMSKEYSHRIRLPLILYKTSMALKASRCLKGVFFLTRV